MYVTGVIGPFFGLKMARLALDRTYKDADPAIHFPGHFALLPERADDLDSQVDAL